ncbi:hypothetical protein K4L44_13975 [Halosquirtibacter laminarini]|uniref:Uncharacterized protein n=1 Tax=Halosquirtibacter laminarini TaxID=3374600 RepID=A0AC61NDN0_9BACT|nr:hypothetical protein K4L44_13975 [Prolixibacteraceae bacterium]
MMKKLLILSVFTVFCLFSYLHVEAQEPRQTDPPEKGFSLGYCSPSIEHICFSGKYFELGFRDVYEGTSD